MLTQVSASSKLRGVFEISYPNIHCDCRFVLMLIMHQDDLHTIRKDKVPMGTALRGRQDQVDWTEPFTVATLMGNPIAHLGSTKILLSHREIGQRRYQSWSYCFPINESHVLSIQHSVLNIYRESRCEQEW